MFLVMRPSRFQSYDAASIWERNDAESSSQLLKAFAEHYVIHLEVKLRTAAGDAALALAKQPRAVETSTSGNGSREERPATTATTGNRYTPNNARREARKLDTEAKYASWQKAYRRLLKNRPNMSDVWYSQQIAKMDIAKGSSPETIRKNMRN
jgi:chromatin remodeling complex protein RSC6